MKEKFYKLPEKYKYSVAFENKLIPLTDEKAEKYISLASQESLKKYFPKNIDFAKKEDCLAIAGQSFIANKINLNDDGVDSETAIRIAELFPYSYIDALHKQDKIVGVIITASFTDLETNKELTKEEVRAYTKPFAVTIGGIVWKLANKGISEALQDVELKDSLYLSWEIAFNDYQLILLEKDKYDTQDGKIVTSAEQIRELDQTLRVNGGSGKSDKGMKVARIIMGDVIPLGVGIVENPAGQLDPIVVDTKEDTKTEVKADIEVEVTIPETSKLLNKLADVDLCLARSVEMIKSSLENFTKDKLSVTQSNNTNIIMDKINNLKDITDESLKVVKASVVHDFIGEELKKADEKFKAEQKETAVAKDSLADTQKELEKVKAALEVINQEKAAKAAQELFDQRMSYFDDTYELSKEERQAIASDIKDLNQESFDKTKSKYEIFLKEKSKASIQAKNDAAAKAAADKEEADKAALALKNQSTASVTVKVEDKVLDDAIKNGKEVDKTIPNAQGGELSFLDKFRESFKPENCIVVSK